MKRLRIATVFSGIGAFEQALKKQNIDYEILFACDNGEREISESFEQIEEYVKKNNLSNDETNDYVKKLYSKTKKENEMKKSYMANYEVDEKNWYEDVRFIDGSKYKNKVDIFVGGSPCQSFSMMGHRGGLDDVRGTLFFDYARLVQEIQPKVFIYENVPGMINHDNGRTWEKIQEVFIGLNYRIKSEILNSKDYGIPQNRKRLFVVGFKNRNIEFSFPKKMTLTTNMFDFLEEKPNCMYYLGKKGFEFVTNPKYRGRASVNNNVIRTQKANQQFNWNGDFVFEQYDQIKDREDILSRAYVGEWNGKKGVIRQLTHRECFRLMGFSDEFDFNNVSNVWRYRQAGNSIVVNVLEEIMKEIVKVENFDERIKLATVFSGIGSVEFAFRRLGIESEVVFACDNGERDIDYDKNEEFNKIKNLKTPLEKKEYVDRLYDSKTRKHNFVKDTYLNNYTIDNDLFFQDICLLDGTDFKGKIDLFVGGSPCQSFSQVGFQRGLDDTRGTLFYEFARLVKEIRPKVFIYENVRNMLRHDGGKTWEMIKGVFDGLGYEIDFDILNSLNFDIPQKRNRLFVIGFDKKFGKKPYFPRKIVDVSKYVMQDFLLSNCEFGKFTYDKKGDIVIDNSTASIIPERYFLSDAVKSYVLKDGTKNWHQKVEIDLPIARTILKTMGNCHRAGVDNYITENNRIRMLTEREAHRLMGYTDDFNIVVSVAQAYKQAGNSIVVDVLMALVKYIILEEIV